FISNALKFTTHGEVRVRAVMAAEGIVRFSVTDTGIGIAAEHVGELFRDYAQIDSAIQKRLRGTGLGLSLSKKLALVLGGDVHVSSQIGQGSVFSVSIPITL